MKRFYRQNCQTFECHLSHNWRSSCPKWVFYWSETLSCIPAETLASLTILCVAYPTKQRFSKPIWCGYSLEPLSTAISWTIMTSVSKKKVDRKIAMAKWQVKLCTKFYWTLKPCMPLLCRFLIFLAQPTIIPTFNAGQFCQGYVIFE
jgi:hypothetical protein